DLEGSDNDYPSLAFIVSRIEEISKKKSEKWSILRDLQVGNSEEPEPELDSESGTKFENGVSNDLSEKSSPPPKFEPLEVSLSFKDEKGKMNALLSPVISNHERNDFRPFSSYTRNEQTISSSNTIWYKTIRLVPTSWANIQETKAYVQRDALLRIHLRTTTHWAEWNVRERNDGE
ncbi:15101_t:CDS:2, partial [Acaulospora colombiana]